MIDKKKIRAKMIKILDESNWKLGKNSIPTAYQFELDEIIARIQKRMVEEAPHRELINVFTEYIKSNKEFKDATPEEIDEGLKYLMQKSAQFWGEIIQEVIGNNWKKWLIDMKDDMDGLNLDTEYPTHYDTLEECSADYVLRRYNGDYKNCTIAWKDAVARRITYIDKNSNRVELNGWKQLQRALDRIKDKNEVERYELQEIFPDCV